jgi:ribonuclease D
MTFRRRQRSKHHHAAHEGAQEHPPPLAHPQVPASEPQLITSVADLEDFLGHVRQVGSFAFDTEFIGEVAYFPKTCLVQLATSQRIALVDPIAVRDLRPVWECVGDPATTTIVHAGASDLSPVRRMLRREPENIIDVQVAAGFAGMAYPSSLLKVVDRWCSFPISKGHTFTDWDARPLSTSQLRYAADDVRYLPLVWELLRGELAAKGRIPWAVAETRARLEDPHHFDADAQMRRASRGYDLTEAQEALLRALCVLRDKIAQREDMPHRSTIPDGSLLEIVRSRPATRADIAAIRGMPRPIVARHGDALVKVIEEHPSETVQWFAVRRRRDDSPELRAKVDSMLAEAQHLCETLGIAMALAVTRSDLERFARRRASALERGEQPPPLFDADDWRSAAFSDAIEQAADRPPRRPVDAPQSPPGPAPDDAPAADP